MNIEIHERNRFNELLHKIHNNIEDTAFKLLLSIPEDVIPSSLMNWAEHYIDKRMNELQYQLIRDNWRSVELEKAAVQLNSKIKINTFGFFHWCLLLNICFAYDIIVYVIEQKVGCDFPIVRCPLVYKGG